MPEATGRPSYHPATLVKLYIYGYLNRVAVEPSAGDGEAHRNLEVIWLHRAPDARLQDHRRLPAGQRLWNPTLLDIGMHSMLKVVSLDRVTSRMCFGLRFRCR